MVAQVVQDCLGFRNLLAFFDELEGEREEWATTVPVLTKKELGNTLGFDIAPGEGLMVLSDSTAAIGTASKDPTKRTRQFELNAHFVRDAVAFRTVDLKYVTTKCQYADALTKAADAAVMAGAKALMASTIPMPASFKLYGKLGG